MPNPNELGTALSDYKNNYFFVRKCMTPFIRMGTSGKHVVADHRVIEKAIFSVIEISECEGEIFGNIAVLRRLIMFKVCTNFQSTTKIERVVNIY